MTTKTKTRKPRTNPNSDMTTMEAAFAASLGQSGGTSGNAVTAAIAAQEVIQQSLAPEMDDLMKPFLDEFRAAVDELHAVNKVELALHQGYEDVIERWDTIQRKILARRQAWRDSVAPLKKQLEADVAQAKKFPTWLTFERSAEIAALLKKMSSPAEEEKVCQDLLAELEGMRDEYNEAKEWLALNASRREARQAEKAARQQPSVQ